MKHILRLSLLFVAPLIVAAQTSGYVPLSDIPGITSPDVVNSSNLTDFWNALYRICIGAAVVLALVQIIRGGLSYMTTDSFVKIGDAKGLIWQSIIGLVLVLSPVLVLGIINPDIFSLELDTKAVSTDVGESAYQGAQSSSATTEQTTLSNGVVRTIRGTLFKKATFASPKPEDNNKAAQQWIKECADTGGIGSSFGFQQGSTCTSEAVFAGSEGKTCTAATDAGAVCGSFSSKEFLFIDVVSRFYTLTVRALPSNAEEVNTFVATCSANGGKAYLPIYAGTNKSAPAVVKLDTCPETVIDLPAGATGGCWRAYLACMDELPMTDTSKNGGGVRGYLENVDY